ncbi:MAG: NrfD/PsrC family molybdoenzyme membrane anchor subunit [Gammaproteobacteria bacterium]
MSAVRFTPLEGRSPGYWLLLSALGLLVIAGLAAAHHMDTQGHHVTGMSNQIVWGMPHVFAVFLIVAASGALNVASMVSVFGRELYWPLARLSALLAVTLLLGGLTILVLDLGRPDRLIVAMTHYNFKSIFAWNIFLYTGFVVIAIVYLWMMFERRMNRYAKPVGFVAFAWRLILTTGTGCIFGFLVARQAYDAAIMAPMFIVMSLATGSAIFMLTVLAMYRWTARPIEDEIVRRLANLLGIYVVALMYFVLTYHLTNLYVAEHHGVERFILIDGGIYTWLFWSVQILLGGAVPLILFYLPSLRGSRAAMGIGAALVILGGLAQLYVIIIGGQAYPLILFPGMEVSSSFYDGVVASYVPSLPEIALGIGGASLAGLVTVLCMRVLPFVPAGPLQAAQKSTPAT